MEYTQCTCDVWQLAQLCNHMAGKGWDVVAVVPADKDTRFPVNASEPDGPFRGNPLAPYEVLFRRPLTTEA